MSAVFTAKEVELIDAGAFKITAPLPASDETELPMMLAAVTLAYTEAPQDRLKGADLNTEIGTVHCRAEMVAAFEPSQLASVV